MTTQSKPQNYDELYPGRFLKAGLFKGKNVALTITDIFTEGLASAEDDDKDGDSEPPSVILAFRETKMQLVIPKTNAFCLMSMFGKRLADWVEKKVIFFPSTTKMMGKTVDCIRVWGSPHIAEDMPLLIPQGLKKPLKMTMHAVKLKGESGAETSAPRATSTVTSMTTGAVQTTTWPTQPDAPILDGWSALGWTPDEGQNDWHRWTIANPGRTDYVAHLSALIDQQDAQEAS